MKVSFAVIVLYLICLFLPAIVIAQISTEPQEARNINIKYITGDSVSIGLNESFDMIEDSCSQMVRYTHFNADAKKFYGPFRDVSSLDTAIILTQGMYDKNGLKQGPFISRYVNGNLRTKGNYKNNAFDGNWETYYESGKPKTFFVGANNIVTILNSWTVTGDKVVDNGNGEYIVDLASDHTGGQVAWKGNLVNGRPDGTWKLIATSNGFSTIVNTETHKAGNFVKGIGITGNYKKESRIAFVAPEALPFLQAENMAISSYPCNENTTMFTERVKKNDDNVYVDAHYEDHNRSFWNELFGVLSAEFRRYKYNAFLGDFDVHITAELDEQGKFRNIKSAGKAEPETERGVVAALHNIRILSPATINGKPVKQKFTFDYIYDKATALGKLNYKFLPLND